MEISIKPELEKVFRERAMQRKGYRKGAFKAALEEAIENWLKKDERRRARQGQSPLPNGRGLHREEQGQLVD